MKKQPLQDILGANFYIWGHYFQFWANLCRNYLESIFQGKIYCFVGNKTCFFGVLSNTKLGSFYSDKVVNFKEHLGIKKLNLGAN